MKNLIKGLLDYSRIGRNKELSTFELNEVLDELKVDLSTNLEETNTQLKVGKLPRIRGYRMEIRLLMQNLILNAIKFRKRDISPNISIAAKETGPGVWKLSFKDNGIGIAKEHSEKIFTIFQRLHLREEYEGTGIGLAHCQKIAALHGGSIWVESELGVGSVFNFTLVNKDVWSKN